MTLKNINENLIETVHITQKKCSPYVKLDKSFTAALQEKKLSAYSIAIFTVLGTHVFIGSNFSSVSLYDLCQLTQLSKNTVIKSLKELEEKGFIDVFEKGKGRSKKTYQLTFFFNGHKQTPNTIDDVTPNGSSDEPLKPSNSSPDEPLQACINNNITNQKKTSSKKSRHDKQVRKGGDKSFDNFKKSKSTPGILSTKEFIHKSEYVFEYWELCKNIIDYSQKLGKIGEIRCMNKYLEAMYRSNERVGWEYAQNELKRLIQEWDEFKKKEKIIWVEDVTKTSSEDKSPEDIKIENHNQKVLELLHQTGHYDIIKRDVIAKSKTPQFLKGRFLDMEIIQEYESSQQCS